MFLIETINSDSRILSFFDKVYHFVIQSGKKGKNL